MKRCGKCKQLKNKTHFYNNSRTPDGLYGLCKLCSVYVVNKYARTVNGLITSIYSSQKTISKRRGHPLPDYTKQELKQWILNHYHFEIIYDNWVSSGFDQMLKPSCDRFNDYKPYTLDNLNPITTWEEHQKKTNFDKINGVNNKQSKAVVGTCIKTGKILKFYSQKQAQRDLGIASASISKCCLGLRNKSGGYTWKFSL